MSTPDSIHNRPANRHAQILRYLIVGGWNTLFGMLAYAGLYHVIGQNVHYLVLLVPSNVLAVTNAYVCYRIFVFRSRGNIVWEYLRCYLVYGGMMLVSAVLMYVLVDWLHVFPTFANCLCTAATTVVSFFAHRNFSFRPPSKLPGRSA